jgi:hypothetical protein
MDELCNMMSKNSILCQDDNNEEIKLAYHTCRSLLSKEITQEHYVYVDATSKRYRTYKNNIKFTPTFRYLENMMSEYVLQVDYTLHDDMNIPYLLLLSNFINSEILTVIGELCLC